MTQPTPRDDWQDEDYDGGLLELLASLIRRRRLVLGLPITATLATLIVVFLIPKEYTATASFVPEQPALSGALPGGLAGLASQFGIGLPGGGQSPSFYADLLESRTIRDEILQSPVVTAEGETPRAFIDILDIDGDNSTERLEKARRKLGRIVSVRVNDQTSIVSIAVETRYPAVSADIANRFLTLVNRFNLETRSTNARVRRIFVEERVVEAERGLRAAEDDLQSFLVQNRDIASSPQLQVQRDRLQRQVAIKQEVSTSLQRQHEEARIQEVNDTPVITTIDRAVPPDKKSSPQRILITLLVLFLSSALSVSLALVRDSWDRASVRGGPGVEALASQLREFWGSVRAPFRGRRTLDS